MSALASRTGISRATFYRLFDTPADVITVLVPVAITDWIARGARETAEELSIRVRAVLRLAAI